MSIHINLLYYTSNNNKKTYLKLKIYSKEIEQVDS